MKRLPKWFYYHLHYVFQHMMGHCGFLEQTDAFYEVGIF